MINITEDFDLTDSNTFAMRVKCDSYVEYDEISDIPDIVSSFTTDSKYFHIGAGSNLLFTGDFRGTILHSAIRSEEFVSEGSDEIIIRVGSGVVMDDFIRRCCSLGLWGLENLSGIPGEVGASAVQNVGAYGREACDAIAAVHVFDTKERVFRTLPNSECDFSYRHSIFKRNESKGRFIIHHVDYRLSPKPNPCLSYPALTDIFDRKDLSELTPSEVRDEIIGIRNRKLPDPTEVPSAGSFFKNPVISKDLYQQICQNERLETIPHYIHGGGYKIPAAWLIERCGWKGKTIGNVAVWYLQPLVIVNPDRKASPDEVISLENQIIKSVNSRFGIILNPEVEHI